MVRTRRGERGLSGLDLIIGVRRTGGVRLSPETHSGAPQRHRSATVGEDASRSQRLGVAITRGFLTDKVTSDRVSLGGDPTSTL